jgi:hypothetical protein
MHVIAGGQIFGLRNKYLLFRCSPIQTTDFYFSSLTQEENIDRLRLSKALKNIGKSSSSVQDAEDRFLYDHYATAVGYHTEECAGHVP